MADTTITPAQAAAVAPSQPTANPEPTPEQKASMEQAQIMQHLEAEIARGKRMLAISCLNLCNLAINTLPRPDEEEDAPAKNKKNPSKRTLTMADLDKVSAIVERFASAVANLAAGGPMGPMGMMRGMR